MIIKIENKNIIKKRNFKITPFFVNKEIFIHNGISLSSIIISENMIGHKIGEFFNTRKTFRFKKKKSKN